MYHTKLNQLLSKVVGVLVTVLVTVLAIVLVGAFAEWVVGVGVGDALAADVGAEKTEIFVFQRFFCTETILGNLIIWLLIAMSVAVVALLIHFMVNSRKASIMPDKTIKIVQQLLDDRNYQDAVEYAAADKSDFGRIIHASLSQASYGFSAMENAIEEAGDLAGSRRMRALEYLNVLGAIGPMIGLFGTVYGMIVAFQTLADTGAQAGPGLPAGISTALVTTFWGLIVGIPAVATYFLMRNKIETLITESMVTAELMIERFRPNGDGTDEKLG